MPVTAVPHLHVPHRLCSSALQERLLGLLGLHTPDVAQREAPAYGLPHGWWIQVYIIFSFVTPADTHSLRSQGEALVMTLNTDQSCGCSACLKLACVIYIPPKCCSLYFLRVSTGMLLCSCSLRLSKHSIGGLRGVR